MGRSILYSFFGACLGFIGAVLVNTNPTALLLGSIMGLCLGFDLSLWVNRLYSAGTFAGREYTYEKYGEKGNYYGQASAIGIGLMCAAIILWILSSVFDVQLGEMGNGIIIAIFIGVSLLIYTKRFSR